MGNRKVLCHFSVAALSMLWQARPAEASFIVNVVQSGSNVVGTGLGSINLAGLTFAFSGSAGVGEVIPSVDLFAIGAAAATEDFYTGTAAISPSHLGPGGAVTGSSGAGPLVGISSSAGFEIPHGYVSGTSISDSVTWNSTTIAGLGLTPGTYVYSWGSGPSADTLTLNVGATPEPGSMALLALGGLGLALRRWRKRV
jgi:hypothetical protein